MLRLKKSTHNTPLLFLVKELLRRNPRDNNRILTFLSVKAKLEHLAQPLAIMSYRNSDLPFFPPVSRWIEPIHLKLQLSPWRTKLVPISLQYSGGKLCPYVRLFCRGWELHKLHLPQTANQRVIILPWKKDWERARFCCHPRSRVLSLVIVVQSLSRVRLFAIPRTAACQASLSTISQSLLKLMSIESVIPSSQLILCRPHSSCPQSFPVSWSFPMSRFFTSGCHRIEASASASVLTMNIQDWFPLGLTGVISLLSKGLSRVFSSTTVRKHPFFGTQSTFWSNSHICTWLLEEL